MSLAIHRLLESEPGREGFDAFVEAHDFPLAEGSNVTFVYRGKADRVELRHWIYGLPSAQPFQRASVSGANSDFWYLVMTLPPKSRVEYKIDVIRGDNHHWIRDPLNPHLAHDPFGANSVCHGEGYSVPAWARLDPESRAGELHKLAITSDVFGERREVQVYLPARFRRRRRYPLLIVHDGADYLRFANLKAVLDNLIHRQEVRGLIAVLTHSSDRLREYANDGRHARFLAEEVVPLLQRRLPLIDDPDARCLMGASFGGVASFSTACRYPGFFGRLLLQSGSFAFTDIGPNPRGPAFDPVVRFINEYRREPKKVSERVFQSCGVYESLIYENRSMLPLLQSTGMEVRYTEARDGHNWENWRDRLREGLSWLFPGPLWMVYE